MRALAARIRFLTQQADDLYRQLATLVAAHPAGPALLSEPGVGPVVAAQLLISWSHSGRVCSEAAFGTLAGVSPIETSSGQTIRHRLNRGGDRALNRALHTVVLVRLATNDQTRAYARRRTAEGKTSREIRRCLKRYLARHLYRVTETAHHAAPAATPVGMTA